jgi:hypothetical protein
MQMVPETICHGATGHDAKTGCVAAIGQRRRVRRSSYSVVDGRILVDLAHPILDQSMIGQYRDG